MRLLVVLSFIFFISCGDEDNSIYENYDVSNGNHLLYKNGNPFLKEYLVLENWRDSQGGAIYGDLLLNVLACDENTDDAENVFLWNLNTGDKIAAFTLGYTLKGFKYYKPHANTVCFGKEYHSDSEFPLLYVSQTFGLEYGKKEYKKSGVHVYKIMSNNAKYEAELVQVIRPSIDDICLLNSIGPSIHNFIVDIDDSKLYVVGYCNNDFYNPENSICVTSFNLPLSSDGTEVVLTSRDILNCYTLPMSYCIQSVFYDNGFLYIMNGDSSKYKWLRSLNLKTHKIESKYDFTYVAGEPQFCGFWKGKFLMYFAGSTGILYEITDR